MVQGNSVTNQKKETESSGSTFSLTNGVQCIPARPPGSLVPMVLLIIEGYIDFASQRRRPMTDLQTDT